MTVPRPPPGVDLVVPIADESAAREAALSTSKSASHRPSLQELRDVGRQWIRANNAELLLTDQQKWAIANGVFLLFTVPYLPPTQPIEFVWGTVKDHLRSNYTVADKGNPDAVMLKIAKAFGATGLLPGMLAAGGVVPPSAIAQRYVRHTLDWSNDHLIPLFPELAGKGGIGTLELPPATVAQVGAWTTPGNMDVYFADNELEESDAVEADTGAVPPDT